MEKELLIEMISNIENEDVIHFLYSFSKDFISRHSVKQTNEPYSKEN